MACQFYLISDWKSEGLLIGKVYFHSDMEFISITIIISLQVTGQMILFFLVANAIVIL